MLHKKSANRFPRSTLSEGGTEIKLFLLMEILLSHNGFVRSDTDKASAQREFDSETLAVSTKK